MAKELLQNNVAIEPSVDIFSFGIMLFELTTGTELPQDGPYWHALREGETPAIPREYSSELNLLIRHVRYPRQLALIPSLTLLSR